MINRCIFAITQEESRYTLNGALLKVKPGSITLVTTDGHRLAMSTADCANPGVDSRVQAIVPRKGVLELSRLLDGESETVELQLGGNHLKVQSGPFTMTTKLVDGQFPDYEKVVPSDGSRFLTGDRETLRQAFQRASILSN